MTAHPRAVRGETRRPLPGSRSHGARPRVVHSNSYSVVAGRMEASRIPVGLPDFKSGVRL
jgi:hypothetical protein